MNWRTTTKAKAMKNERRIGDTKQVPCYLNTVCCRLLQVVDIWLFVFIPLAVCSNACRLQYWFKHTRSAMESVEKWEVAEAQIMNKLSTQIVHLVSFSTVLFSYLMMRIFVIYLFVCPVACTFFSVYFHLEFKNDLWSTECAFCFVRITLRVDTHTPPVREEHIMITLWQTSSTINLKFTTQAQCRPANIQIYGHVRRHSGYSVRCFMLLQPIAKKRKKTKSKTTTTTKRYSLFYVFLCSSFFSVFSVNAAEAPESSLLMRYEMHAQKV